jgi:hypothetical protein
MPECETPGTGSAHTIAAELVSVHDPIPADQASAITARTCSGFHLFCQSDRSLPPRETIAEAVLGHWQP